MKLNNSSSDKVIIYRWFITVKGKRIYPKNGRPFRLEIPADKYKSYNR